ncbi:hypothetical protein FE89_34430, partial [Azospirillum brasilense]
YRWAPRDGVLMARVWIEDRIGHTAYARALAEAKRNGRTPPGRYRVRWYDPDGKPKMKTLARKVDAEAERTRMESRLNDGSYRDLAAARVKFVEVAESWLRRSTSSARPAAATGVFSTCT